MNDLRPKIEILNPVELPLLRKLDNSLPQMHGGNWRQAWDDLYHAAYNHCCWVAKAGNIQHIQENKKGRQEHDDRVIVGFITAPRRFLHHRLIDRLCVTESEQRDEIAQSLIRAVENRCRGDVLFAVVAPDNNWLIPLLKEAGYREVGSVDLLTEQPPRLIWARSIPKRRQDFGNHKEIHTIEKKDVAESTSDEITSP